MTDSTDDDDDVHEVITEEEFRTRLTAIMKEWIARSETPSAGIQSMTLVVDYDYDHARVTLRRTRREDRTYEYTSSLTTWVAT